MHTDLTLNANQRDEDIHAGDCPAKAGSVLLQSWLVPTAVYILILSVSETCELRLCQEVCLLTGVTEGVWRVMNGGLS